MAIEVRIPTILRSYTGGAKVVDGTGDTLADLLTDLDSRHGGLRGRLITDAGTLHRFVNVYVNDEDVRFLGALDAKLSDGDSVTILPAVAGGAFGFAAAAAISSHSAAAAAISARSAAAAAISSHSAAAAAISAHSAAAAAISSHSISSQSAVDAVARDAVAAR